jgi:replication factor C small subunit
MEKFETWSETYRPKTLTDIIGQKHIIPILKSYVTSKNIPHIICAGPQGTGKTTAMESMLRDLYQDAYDVNVLELNASDDRGIQVIRGKIKDFAKEKSLGEVPYKVCWLDESDQITLEGQGGLRRMMEKYVKNCRFVLTANYLGKIIEPIQSRCNVFRFRFLSIPDQLSRLRYIANQEQVVISSTAIEALAEVSRGDMRKAITILQSAATAYKQIDDNIIYTIVGRALPVDIQKIIQTALKGQFSEARAHMRSVLQTSGVTGIDLARQIHTEMLKMDIPEIWKYRLATAVAEADYRLSEGTDDEVQLSALLAKIMKAGYLMNQKKIKELYNIPVPKLPDEKKEKEKHCRQPQLTL